MTLKIMKSVEGKFFLKTYLEDEKPSTSALVIVSELKPFLCCLTVAEHLRPRRSALFFLQACVLSRVRCAPGCCRGGGFPGISAAGGVGLTHAEVQH